MRLSVASIPVSSYDFQTAEIIKVTNRTILGASKELSDETAYTPIDPSLKTSKSYETNIAPGSLSAGLNIDLQENRRY
jgi:TRAP-type uncharacterized transport system substrate-binding protein